MLFKQDRIRYLRAFNLVEDNCFGVSHISFICHQSNLAGDILLREDDGILCELALRAII